MSDVTELIVVDSTSDSNDGSDNEETTFKRWYLSPLSSPEFSPTKNTACYKDMPVGYIYIYIYTRICYVVGPRSCTSSRLLIAFLLSLDKS